VILTALFLANIQGEHVMVTRKAFRAGSFYPLDDRSCRQQIEECLGGYQPPAEPAQIVAGVVPHAGWVFSGPTAAKVFQSIKAKMSPTTFLIFGAVHVWGVDQAALFAEGVWQTPCGAMPIDTELAEAILRVTEGDVIANAEAHTREHSIEVQIPFIQYLFPDARIVPIMIAPDTQATQIGQKIGAFLAQQSKPVIVIGSTDLTHYGPSFGFTPYGVGVEALAPMKANDERLIHLITELNAEKIIPETAQHHNACGAGAIAATIAAAQALGAQRGYLLEHTTSQDVMPERRATDFVGYAGIVF
jgi:MEMO1 family protein